MKVFTCTSFRGHYSVGVAAVVCAPDAEEAADLLIKHLHEVSGLIQSPSDMSDIRAGMVEVDITLGVTILRDGDY